MRGWIASWVAGCALLGIIGGSAPGQAIQRGRSVTATGPRGRTLERAIRSRRGPGHVDREIEIQRPAGTIRREWNAQRGPGHIEREVEFQRGDATANRGVSVQRGPTYGGYYRHGPPAAIERGVVVERGLPWGPAIGIAAPFLSFSFGRSLPPPPPPVYVAPPPLVVAPSPAFVTPEPPPADPLADALARLHSGHDNSRRDGALSLGQIGDARAVPPLIDRLERDGEKDVRIASAWALAEIGDPRAGVALERAALFDRKRDVREAAATAYRRLQDAESVAGSAEFGPRDAPEAIASDPRIPPPPPPEPPPTSSGDEPGLPPVSGPLGFPDSP